MLTGGQRGGKAWHRQQARLPGGDLALKFPAEPCAPRDGGSESAPAAAAGPLSGHRGAVIYVLRSL